MRGTKSFQQESMFSYISLEDAIPRDHGIRRIKTYVDDVLEQMSGDFAEIYSATGRPSIPPEQLLKALLIQVLFTVRSERQLIEQLNYNLLFRWFVGLGMSGKVWDRTSFSKNRARLIDGAIADRFFALVVQLADRKGLISKEHFSVDGTLLEAWASLKSFQKKADDESSDDDNSDAGSGRNSDVNFKGEKRSNETHESAVDSEARLFTKSRGQSARLSFMGHVLMENRNGLAVDARLSQASGRAETDAAFEMASVLRPGATIGADKGYDRDGHTENLRQINIKSHAAQNLHARRHSSALDCRTTRHEGYQVSQRKRKRIEEIFGWLKTIGLLRRPMYRGKRRLDWVFSFALSAYNLIRIRNLCAQ
jgi:transposase